MCLAKPCGEILSNLAGRLGAWQICFCWIAPFVWQLGVQIQHANGLPIRCTHSAFCSMHISKYFLRHWAETLNCALHIRLILMGLWAATVALMLRGPITLHLHIVPHPTPRRIYKEQCLWYSEARTGSGV